MSTRFCSGEGSKSFLDRLRAKAKSGKFRNSVQDGSPFGYEARFGSNFRLGFRALIAGKSVIGFARLPERKLKETSRPVDTFNIEIRSAELSYSLSKAPITARPFASEL